MAGERMAGAMSMSATGMTGAMEIHTKLQVQNRVAGLEHMTRQTDGSLMTTNMTLTDAASPIIVFTTHDLTVATLNTAGLDKQAVTNAVFTQPVVGIVGKTKITATFTAGVLIRGDLKGGDAPNTEAEQEYTFISTVGVPTYAEAA